MTMALGLGTVGLASVAGRDASAATPPGAIVATVSGKCIGVANASKVAQTAVVLQDCISADHQSWSLRSVGNGYYNVVARHSGLCLSVRGSSRTTGAEIVQAPCARRQHSNDSWRIEPIGSGHRLAVKHSDMCLQASGTKLSQTRCGSTANETFNVGPINPAAPNASSGQWSAAITLPLVPAAGAALRNGRLLMWSASANMMFGDSHGVTQTVVYNPDANTIANQTVSDGHDMFCPGTNYLADGRLLVTGGLSPQETSIYNGSTGQWETAAPMTVGRGYHSSVTLGDGSALVVGGSWSGGIGEKNAEVYADGKWRALPNLATTPMSDTDPEGQFRSDNHMWLFAWTGNRAFKAGPASSLHWLSTNGQGSATQAGTRGKDNTAMNGTAVMYEPGKILTLGGAPAYKESVATTNANIIDINGRQVTATAIGPMASARAFHHSVVLPSGEVFVVGGQSYALPFSDDTSVLTPELFNPRTKTFRALAPMQVPRNYHSFGVLLADGRVAVGGGGLCEACESSETNHPNIEIFTPPYLLRADGSPASRPSITSAPTSANYGSKMSVTTDRSVSNFALVRLASETHSVNTDQRRIPVKFSRQGNTSSLSIPSDPGVAPPGDYLLFAMDAAGVPSVSKTVRLVLAGPGRSGEPGPRNDTLPPTNHH